MRICVICGKIYEQFIPSGTKFNSSGSIMAEVIQMPLLSDTMTEGVVAAWHKKVGDSVVIGDLLAEIETDKATMDFEAPAKGVLLHVGVAEGDAIPVGSLLAIIGNKGEDVAELVKNAASGASAAAAPAAQEAPAAPAEASAPAAPVPAPEAAPVATNGVSTPSDDRIKASPLAKAMAKEKGINLGQVSGTGEHGRIIKRDIENFKAPAVGVATTQIAAVVGEESYEEVKLSQMRKTIAKRLGESKFQAPHFYLTMEIDMDRAVAARKSINEVAEAKISFNVIVMKAVTAALRMHPKVNASWTGNAIRYNHHIHLGMAVAVDEGLVVPVIKFADAKGMVALANESRDLALRARDKKLGLDEMQGNTFTISNLGMFGIEEFTAIINPPDACILAVGAIRQVPVVKNGAVVPGNTMKVTLSCDHRVVDGAVGSAFLKTLKELLEEPVRILL